MRWPAAAAACLAVLAGVAAAGWLQSADPDLYYRSVQEDEWLEWASFWAFALAAGLFAWVTRSTPESRRAWWPLGLALFCGFVALEEISWGQRVVGYRPPAYFLEHNFQQELNLHNVVGQSHRKLALQAVILGYGLVLPLVAVLPWSRDRLERLGVSAPPAGLAPAFVATFLLYRWYPWDFSGEWVEAMLGLGFLFAAGAAWRPTLRAVEVAGVFALTLALGAGSAAATTWQRSGDTGIESAARAEVEALSRDFASGRAESRCGLHKRLYTYVEQYEERGLLEGEFASLTAQGLPEDRARYLLDPWNSPYWLRHACSGGRETAFVYSFGPNRVRDSSRRELRGDDVGAYLVRPSRARRSADPGGSPGD